MRLPIYLFRVMKILSLLLAVAAFVLSGCGTFSGAGQTAEQNLDQGLEGRGELISPNQMGDRFGSYYQ